MSMQRRILWLIGSLLCVPGLLEAQAQGRPELPPGEGREVAQAVCGNACHDATAVLMKRDGEVGWRRNVERMIVQKGAHVSSGDLETIVKYLSTVLGPGTARMQTTGTLPPGSIAAGVATAKEVRLPDGAGREIVTARCTLCHDLGRVVSVRRTSQDWEHITKDMMSRGPQTTPAEVQTIQTYLTTHFRAQ
jgi:cytochrome c5